MKMSRNNRMSQKGKEITKFVILTKPVNRDRFADLFVYKTEQFSYLTGDNLIPAREKKRTRKKRKKLK